MTAITRPLSLIGTGVFMPPNCVSAADIDKRLRKPDGFSLRLSGPQKRYFVGSESSSMMAAEASKAAIKQAGLEIGDIDLIISASGVTEQPIPTQAVFISRHLGLMESGIPAYDINATCLSFLVALDTISDAIAVGRYKTVLIVSSEIASRGLNWENPTNSVLFGDGAAAAVLKNSHVDQQKGIMASLFETYPEGADYCQLRAGGTELRLEQNGMDAYQVGEKYEMNGAAAYKLTAEILPGFISRLLNKCEITFDDIDLIIPHQASQLSMYHMTQVMGVSADKIMDIYAGYGNQIAASIPTALHVARTSGRLKEGMTVLLAGTAAGITLGGIIMRV